ncbi:MAG: CYTH domain-containing protein [Gammaproteobacteria bacterium]|nr:CYTH domain-containing protein [Gammaproteobacteria bacterium]
MAVEIERKFLITSDGWLNDVGEGIHYRQGYLSSNEKSSVRIRIEGERANINIKGATVGLTRSEFEYPLPLEDAQELLDTLCDPRQLEKRRYHLRVGEHQWEVDQFLGENLGLVVAEIELSSEEEPFQRPSWLGEEVSHDTRYYNSCLCRHPYSRW